MLPLIPWKRRRKQASKYPDLSGRFRSTSGIADAFPSLLFSEANVWQPKVDIKEGKRHVTLRAEMPGMDKNDIDISLENGILRIAGERRGEKEDTRENYYRREALRSRFLRRIELAAEVDENDAPATYKRGILTVRLKKTKDTPRRRIQVKSR